ncbi:MAG: hydantoinase B/oxoprolinase family protein [Planctomycetota bacterium]|nr:hydantoinase B/oxoprolinase family protein [Planctomycetota bacterium]
MNHQSSATNTPWRIAIDTGGTFTDGIGIAPDGAIRRVKVLSNASIRVGARFMEESGGHELTFRGLEPAAGLLRGFTVAHPGGPVLGTVADHPDPNLIRIKSDQPPTRASALEIRAPFDAPRLCLLLLVGSTPERVLPTIELRVATTRATNALLERSGEPFGLVVDRGFEDLLLIGDQSRPDLFDLDIRRDPLVADLTVPLSSRLDSEGHPDAEPSADELDSIVDAMTARGLRTVGVSLVHGWRNPGQENSVAEALKSRGISSVICGTDLSRSEGLTARTETLAVEASIRPVMERFIDGLSTSADPESTKLFVMTSSGGLAPADRFTAKDGLLSGPAGGVVGAARAGKALGFERVLGFDMGGTSTDVSRYDHQLLYRFETRVGPARIQAPCVAIETVAAGGGSICHWGSNGLAVGPQSAGASPGPACYGAGGPLTITDVNLLLGRADPDSFGIPIDLAAAEAALGALTDAIRSSGTQPPDRCALLIGLLDIANERMAEAMRAISIREGADPKEHVLVPFGGAGGQHACAIAHRLNMDRILLPIDAGILSARGALIATNEQFAERTLNQPLTDCRSLEALYEALEDEATGRLPRPELATTRGIVGLRLEGQDEVLQIPCAGSGSLEEAFHEQFRKVYGYPPPDRVIEVAWLRVRASEGHSEPMPAGIAPDLQPRQERTTIELTVDGSSVSVPVLRRHQIRSGTPVRGPFLLVDPGATTVIDPGWEVVSNSDGSLLCTRHDDSNPTAVPSIAGGSAASELVATRLESIATSMGRLLERTALSVNVKQRLDFSCALLDPQGCLLVNAPHMPIHLGSMGMCVRRSLEHVSPGPGDVLVTNHPGCGGSHLPDITTIAPIHLGEDGGALLGYAAVRAHHAELGGTRPGSTPPFATSLVEEGVLIPPMKLVQSGEERFDLVEDLLTGATWPSRRPEENIADLRAQLAATLHGVHRVREVASAIGADGYVKRADEVRVNSARAASRAIARLGAFDRRVEQALDDGSRIVLHARTEDGRLLLDFTGSSGLHPRNFNAPIAITTGACVYLMRLLVDEAVPMNEGLLESVDLIVPPGMINPDFGFNAASCPAVSSGNTETSQRITDTLLLAFELAACSQGTMNNLLFGTTTFGYYETIAGGAGATSRGPGASGVHTHMTNTRITDPEIMESRFPVMLEAFSLRRGSGGAGTHHGGDGVVRTIRALSQLEVSFVSQHRREGPYGLRGGTRGQPGTQYLRRRKENRTELASCDQCTLDTGDSITIETPGGGGWGPSDRTAST